VSTYLGGDNASGREPTNPTFKRSKVLKIVHEFYPTASGAKRDDAEVAPHSWRGRRRDADAKVLPTVRDGSIVEIATVCR